MNQKTVRALFPLLRSAIYGVKLTEEEYSLYSSELLPDLQQLCKRHDILHLLILGLKTNGLIPKEDMGMLQHILKAVYRVERMNNEYENLCDILEKARIPFIPLKGSVIRSYYPEIWMRTSCDIDILVHEENIERVKSILVNEHGYIYNKEDPHDISFFTPQNIHVELHHKLIEERFGYESAMLLKDIWDMVSIREKYDFWYEMPDEIYYFYHIAHMAKHFEHGGCGIRAFIDLVILDNIQGAEKDKRDRVLEKGNLLKFADNVRKLSRIWFENEEYNPFFEQIEEYIVRGGAYGNKENYVIVQQQKRGGRMKYALSKIFLPYNLLKYHYPILQKHRWLTPVMEVRRWFRLAFCGHAKRTISELLYNSNITNTESKEMKLFLKEMGL